MSAARLAAQAHGYNGLSFRELAKEVGVKSASIHYHFPTKGDLGAALARRYTEDTAAQLARISASAADPSTCLRQYVAIFRKTLETENRMCMCSFMAAEYDDLPGPVKLEVQGFADANIAWLAKVLSAIRPARSQRQPELRARAIFAAIGGAQLFARSRNDLSLFDEIVQSYRTTGLIPD